MKKTLIATAVAACVTAPIGAHAVNVASDGTGEVLLYPYYNVNEGNTTFIAVTNTTDEGKVVKVRFREGVESEDIFDFQLWLSPHDHWSGGIARSGTVIRVTTADTSCTVPTVLGNANAIFNPQRIPAAYLGDDLTRMSEGHVEIIEMGVVLDTNGLLTAITHAGTPRVPNDCSAPSAFNVAAGNLVIRDPADPDLDPPSGGLYGIAAVFNPTDGTYFTYSAEAIELFADTPIFYTQQEIPYTAGPDHTADDSLVQVLYFDLPDISTPDGVEGSAVVNTITSWTFASAAGGGNLPGVPVTVGVHQTDGVGIADNDGSAPGTLPTGADAAAAKRDAITTTMMAARVANDYLTGIAYDTDMVFTFPGRYLYRNLVNADIYTLDPPFTGFVDRTTGRGCQDLSETILYGREEEQLIGDGIDFSPGTQPDVFSLCYEVNVVAINDDAGSAFTGALASNAVRADATSTTNFGWVDLVFGNNSLTDSAGTTQVGLPLLGFSAVTDRATEITRGGTFMHKITRGIVSP